MSSKFLIFIFLLLATEAVSAKIFKWVDKNGETHYSEKAPAEQKVLEVPTAPSPALDNGGNINQANQIKRELESEMKAGKSNREAQEKAQATQQAETRKFRCTEAKIRLNILQQQVRIYKRDSNDEKIYMDDDTRDAEIKKMTAIAASNCASQ